METMMLNKKAAQDAPAATMSNGEYKRFTVVERIQILIRKGWDDEDIGVALGEPQSVIEFIRLHTP